MTRGEISQATGLAANGNLSKKLEELESCGFVRRYHEFGKKNMGAIIQLIDNYTLFYFKFLENPPTDPKFWEKSIDSPGRRAWTGLAFERVCLQHSGQVRKKLGITGVLTDECSWKCNLCEMKYSAFDYTITKEYDRKLKEKVSDFKTVTRTRRAIHLTMITTYSLKRNAYSAHVQSVVTAEDLFQPEDL